MVASRVCLIPLEHTFQKEARGPVSAALWRVLCTSGEGFGSQEAMFLSLANLAFLILMWLSSIRAESSLLSAGGLGSGVPLATQLPKLVCPSTLFNGVLRLFFSSVFKTINHIDSFLFFKHIFHSLLPGVEISPLGISNHKPGNFSKVGRKQYWWPAELSQSLGAGASPDPVRVQLLLLTTVPGSGDCCGCTGGLWDSGI